MKRFFLVLLTVCFLSCSNRADINSVTVTELEEIIKRDSTVQLLDVRTSLEQDSGVILKAKRINYFSNNFVSKSIKTLDKYEPVYVYCASGRRSRLACGVLLDNGYEVYNIDGGYKSWIQNKEN